MEPRPSALGSSDWLGHAEALRRLAHGLVRDGHEADDLVQEVWLRSREAGERPRAWFVTVLRNLVRDRARSRARRAATERAAAHTEALPSGAEIVERLEVAQRLAREVAALDEPQRLAVHLRYFEGQGPEEIAARLGQPLETVRTRLRRGLAELRERMDGAHGGERGAWALALAPLARRGTFIGAGTAGAGLANATGVLMGTKLALSAAAVGLAALGFLWLRHPGEAPPARASSEATAEVRAALKRALPPAAPVAEREELAPTPATGTSTLTAPPASTRTIEGRVVIVDEHEAELTDESGSLTLATGTSEADASIRELPFEDGRFTLELPEGHWVVFGRLLARGREAVLPEPTPLVPDAEPVVVRGRWLKRGRLRVVDADTRAELAGIEVRCAQGWRGNPDWTHPGDHESIEVVVADGTSPIELPDRKWYTPYWVHAPGHAWTRIDFEHKLGGERTVELSSERAAVEVTAQGPAGLFVRLYSLAQPVPDASGIVLLRPPLDEIPSWMADVSLHADASGTTRIEDFKPGRYLAAIESGEGETRLRLGSAEVDVAAGATARVTVPVDAAQLAVPRTHLLGTLRVPEGLALAGCRLSVERLGEGEKDFTKPLAEMSFMRGDRNTLHWDAGPVRTGTYLATIHPFQHRVVIAAEDEGGETRAALELPPLVTVSVEVVDAVTGAALEPERLQWSGGKLDGVDHTTRTRILPASTPGLFRFVAPEGAVDVHAACAGYLEASQAVELTAPEGHVRLELRRATGVELELREGGVVLPLGYEYWKGLRARTLDGSQVHVRIRSAEGRGLALFEEAGSYELVLPGLPGYQAFAPLRVEVRADETVRETVAVERER
jgi:RNA polymerase sigma factor (sigma-70 family)